MGKLFAIIDTYLARLTPAQILKRVIYTSGCILLLGLSFYFAFNHSWPHPNTQYWGVFGDFLNPFVSIANLLAIGGLTYIIYKADQRREIETADKEKTLNKPYLTFTRKRGREHYYHIRNAGNGVAVNLVIKWKTNAKSGVWRDAMVCYSLSKEADLEINWTDKNEFQIAALYTDRLTNERLCSMLSTNQLSVFVIDLSNATHRDLVSMDNMEHGIRYFWQD